VNTLRTALIASAAALAAACSSTPNKPVATATPAIAVIAGNWLLAVETPMGLMEGKMTVIQNGKDIKGRLESQMGGADYVGTVSVNDVKFSYNIESLGGPPGDFVYVGTINAGAMKGNAVFSTLGEGTWSAKRL
jgi:hypothetical protein